MKAKTGYIISAALFSAFVILTVLLKTVDVGISSVGEKIGFYSINTSFFEFTGVNSLWDTVTDVIAAVAIAAAAAFAVLGLVQLIKRKSIKKVDPELLFLGAAYVVSAAFYIFFEIVVINCRPVIMEGDQAAEASYPSSHTFLTCVILATAALIIGKYIKRAGLRLAVQVCCVSFIVITVVGRLLSGVHWLTDICGGVILSASVVYLYSAVISDDRIKLNKTGK